MSAKARVVPVSEFKAKCIALLEAVGESGEEMVVTKYGTPVASVVAQRPSARKMYRPSLAYMVRYAGDVESPIEANWAAMR